MGVWPYGTLSPLGSHVYCSPNSQEGQEFLERSGKKDGAGDSKDEGKEGQK